MHFAAASYVAMLYTIERVGAVAGVLHIIKLIAANCCMAIAISGYLVEITVDSDWVHITAWIGCYLVFTLVHCYGGYSSIYFQNAVVVMCLIVVMLYFFAASRSFDFKRNALGERGWFEGGFEGFILGFPYGIWFMDGFEELPLAVDLASDVSKTVPVALSLCAGTAIFLALGLIFLGASSTDPVVLMNNPTPLMMSFVGVWGDNWFLIFMLDIAILLGLAISFSSFVLLTGRMIQTVSTDGLLPKPLTVTSTTYGTPINATVFSSVAGLVITTAFGLLFGTDRAEDALIACSLLASVTCYVFNFCCLHVVLKTEESLAELAGFQGRSNSTDNNSSAVVPQTGAVPFYCAYGGRDPGSMRFYFGRIGVEFSILLSIIVLACILYIFAIEETYHLGILILCSVVMVSILAVYMYACISTERRVHEELSDMSTRSNTPLTSQ